MSVSIHDREKRRALMVYRFWFAIFVAVYVGLADVQASADWRLEPFVELYQPDPEVPLRATTLAFAPDRTLYIGTGPHGWPTWQTPVQMQRILPGSRIAEPFGPTLGRVDQLAYDATGNVAGEPGLLLIDDPPSFLRPNGITAVSLEGEGSILPGTQPIRSNSPPPPFVRPEIRLERPTDLHITADGNLYVIDAGFFAIDDARRFQRYDPQTGLLPIPLIDTQGVALDSPFELFTITDDPRSASGTDRFLTSGSLLRSLDSNGVLDEDNPLAVFQPGTRRIHVAPGVGRWAGRVMALTDRGITLFSLTDFTTGGGAAETPAVLRESYTFGALGLPADSSISDFVFGPDGFAYFAVQPAWFGGEQIHPGYSGVMRLVPEPGTFGFAVAGLIIALQRRATNPLVRSIRSRAVRVAF